MLTRAMEFYNAFLYRYNINIEKCSESFPSLRVGWTNEYIRQRVCLPFAKEPGPQAPKEALCRAVFSVRSFRHITNQGGVY